MSFVGGPEFAQLLRDLGVGGGFALRPEAPVQTERERKIQALIDRGATAGERQAARAAMERLHGGYNEFDTGDSDEVEDEGEEWEDE